VARRAVLVLVTAGALLPASQLEASIYIGMIPTSAALGVDSKGTAVVSWLQGGVRQTVTVPAHGRLVHGGSLSKDVSRPAAAGGLPNALVVRRTPDGRTWALQSWSAKPGGPVELHLARWKGAPTKLTLAYDGSRLSGRAEFQGKPLTGTSPTLEGKRLRIYVYLDCSGCPGAGSGWKRMIGVSPKADGSFAALVRPEWKGTRYRALVLGPNIGTTFAPDAQATATAGSTYAKFRTFR
jgi:hypothetical protein